MKRFALIGAAGYIADRHMKAIKETGNDLVCVLDQFDVMGKMDSFFPDAEFFMQFEKIEQFMDLQRMKGEPIDYVSVCTPNYLHSAHTQFAMNHGANAICEKPLVLNPGELETLYKMEKATGKHVYNILQLRLHPTIIELKQTIQISPAKKYDVDLTYITSRGKWYHKSWKGDVAKSGGVANNIGIHFFDMLIWIFGKVQNVKVHLYEPDKAAGFIELENARVRWFLSLDANDLPPAAVEKGKRTYRLIDIDSREIEFSDGFTELHTESYSQILAGKGFGLDDASPCLSVTHQIRNTTPTGITGDYHPFLNRLQKK